MNLLSTTTTASHRSNPDFERQTGQTAAGGGRMEAKKEMVTSETAAAAVFILAACCCWWCYFRSPKHCVLWCFVCFFVLWKKEKETPSIFNHQLFIGSFSLRQQHFLLAHFDVTFFSQDCSFVTKAKNHAVVSFAFLSAVCVCLWSSPALFWSLACRRRRPIKGCSPLARFLEVATIWCSCFLKLNSRPICWKLWWAIGRP